MSAKFIIIDGPDCSGKTSLIKKLEQHEEYKGLLKFLYIPKSIDGNVVKIETDTEMALFESVLKYVDPRYVYVIDRGYISNYMFETLRYGKPKSKHIEHYKRFLKNFDVLSICLTRDKLEGHYKDDLISISSNKFNMIIDFYNDVYKNQLGINPIKIIDFDTKNNFLRQNTNGLKLLMERLDSFIFHKNKIQRIINKQLENI